tara:strand:+ start:3358 stop:4047 length:690 start_codon:yes stop_codon:yes gene_type:complete
MSKIKLTIVGSNSDLIQPLIKKCIKNNINIQLISREEWDLNNIYPPENVLKEIFKFNPNQLLFAAGINEKINIHSKNPKAIIESIDKHISINCNSFLWLCLVLQREMNKPLKGIHGISSLYGIYGRKNRLPYSISKHAFEAVIKCLATEFTQTQVLGYRPGFFETKLTSQNITETELHNLMHRIPQKRLGLPIELSEVILSNMMNSITYLSGICITIDGGMTSGGIFEI